MEIQKNQRLRVVGYDPEAKQFKVEFESREYPVRQTGNEIPEYLNCRITRSDEEVEVTREIDEYFHAGALRRFTVRSDMRESAGVYELVDDCGFVVYLYGAEEYSFFKGKQLLCTVVTTEGVRPYVILRERPEVTGSAFSISKDFLKGLLKDRNWDVDTLCDLILYDGMDDPFDVKCYEWVIAQTSLHNEEESLRAFLEDVRGCCMEALENSDLLRKCSRDEVSVLLDRMTLVIEHMGYVRTALQTIAEGKEEDYITDIFRKLKNSGILYHPTKHFCIATYLFRIKPDLMKSKIGELFDVVRSHDLAHWKKEPFRVELIKQLEAFIKVNDAEISQSPDNQELYSLGLQALAIQLLLARDEEDLIDVPLNRSMMYRYASHYPLANKKRMANMSLNALQGLYRNRAAYALPDTALLDKLYYYLDNWGRTQEVDRSRKAIYRSKNLVLRVEDGGITISPDVDKELKSALYEDVNLWHGIDVQLEKKYATPPYRQKGSDLMLLNQKLWSGVENSLFKVEREIKKVEKKLKTVPEIGDDALAYVYKQDENDKNKFYCRINDEENSFIGEGIIYVKSDDVQPGIVQYNPEPTLDNFRDEEGNPYLLEMEVVDKTEENVCIMDMKSIICHRFQDNKPEFHLDCKLYRPISQNAFIAASKDGLPVILTYNPMDVYLQGGEQVKVFLKEGTKWFVNGFAQGRYSCESDEKYTLNDAFSALIRNLSLGVLSMDLTDPTQNEVMLERSQVVELLNIIDEISSVEEDIHISYNYLGFSKMVSRMIGDENRAKYYEGQMEVAQMLHKFAVTNDVDDEKLSNLKTVRKEQLNTNYNLRYQFNTLLAVSYMGGENNEWLMNLSRTAPDEHQRKLASLVYSYNVLHAAGLDAEEVKKAIKEHLNLKGRDAYFKVYDKGEGENVEFKTSIVYPPNAMKIDVEKQTYNIMKELCAFLNHKGGTLYLGVNDEGGGAGLEEDMKHPMFRDSRDKYDTYVRNQIVKHLGQEASHCINAAFDDDAKGRDVYVITVAPCEHPVKLDGKYFQRHGSSSRQVDKDYLPTFLRNRSAEYRQLMKERGVEVADETVTFSESVDESSVAQSASKAEITLPESYQPMILTGTLRNNAIHSFEASYEYVESYIHLVENGKYMVLDNETYDEYMLTLAVHPNEIEGYLLMVYEDAKVGKVPMSRILDKDQGKKYNRFNEVPLAFACPVGDDDVLLQTYEYKGDTYYRIQDVSTIEEVNIGDPGQHLFDVPFDRISKIDVIPSDRKHELPKRITDRRRLGHTIAKKDGAAVYKAVEKLGLL